jgi:tetratricopeptide (TPR) repeat protein
MILKRLMFLSLLSAWFFSGCFLDPSIGREQARRDSFDLFTEGVDLERRGDYRQALDFYLKAIELSPRPAYYYHVAACHGKLGHDLQALDYLNQTLELSPEYPLARAERDLLVQRLGMKNANGSRGADQHEEPGSTRTGGATAPGETDASPDADAMPSTEAGPADEVVPTEEISIAEDMRRVLFPELFGDAPPLNVPAVPAAAPGFLERGGVPSPEDLLRLAEQSGRVDQVILYLEKEIKANPSDWALRLRLARNLARAGRMSRAESELKAAARLAPENAELWFEWGGFYVRQEDWTPAVRCYNECLRIDPSYSKARNNVGVIYLKQGLWERAHREFERVLREKPDFVSAHLNLAIIQAQYLGNLEQAIQSCDEYLRLAGARSAEVRRWRQELLLRRTATEPPEPTSPPILVF